MPSRISDANIIRRYLGAHEGIAGHRHVVYDGPRIREGRWAHRSSLSGIASRQAQSVPRAGRVPDPVRIASRTSTC